MTGRRILPCRECGAHAGRRHDGDYSMCAACGGNRYRFRLTAELSAAINAHHDGNISADDVVTASINQDFIDIVGEI